MAAWERAILLPLAGSSAFLIELFYGSHPPSGSGLFGFGFSFRVEALAYICEQQMKKQVNTVPLQDSLSNFEYAGDLLQKGPYTPA